MEMDSKKLPFLDVLVIISNNKIITDIYKKPTDAIQYVDFHSCHPQHTKINIPFSLARRVCTIVTDPLLKEKQLQELKQDLIKRNNPTNIIDSGIQRAKIIPQHLLRQTSNKNNNAVIPLITTHNPNTPNVLGTVKAGLTILKSSLTFTQNH